MLVFVAMGMGVLLVAGAQLKHIVVTSLIGIVVVIGMFSSDNLGGRPFTRNSRTTPISLWTQRADLQGASYNVNQSQIAIGAGVEGKGARELKQPSTSPNRKPTSYSLHWGRVRT